MVLNAIRSQYKSHSYPLHVTRLTHKYPPQTSLLIQLSKYCKSCDYNSDSCDKMSNAKWTTKWPKSCDNETSTAAKTNESEQTMVIHVYDFAKGRLSIPNDKY
jgi:hypothetical protein